GHDGLRGFRPDDRAIKNAAVNVVIGFDVELQLEIARFTAAPDDVGRADAPFGPVCCGDRATLNLPHLRIAVPVGERPAIENLRPSGVVVVVDWFWRRAA